MKHYRHIFFDLDHTLWDTDKNSAEAIEELFRIYRLNDLGIASPAVFIEKYMYYNSLLWQQHEAGLVDKETLRTRRFINAFLELGVNEEDVPHALMNDFTHLTPTKKNLLPQAKEILSYLKELYTLHIITNGFRETQHNKLFHSGLTPYFTEIIISEEIGFRKPDVRVFHYSLARTGGTARESLMVGDTLESDMKGARDAGIDHVYYNPDFIPHHTQPTFEIRCLSDLKKIL